MEANGDGSEWRWRSEVVEQVRRVAAAEEVSEAAVLLSVWQLLLWRHTEAEEVEVESRVGGRGYEELQGALGTVRAMGAGASAECAAEASWRELLRESAARLEEAEKWQEYFRRSRSRRADWV